jgi:WD40 repeat protein
MKKLQAFLLVGATCIVLLGGLWAAGLLKISPGNEKGLPLPDEAAKGSPPPHSPKQVEKQTPQKLIVGKWQSQFGKMGIRKEYRENGTVMEYPAFGSPKKGTYRLLNDTSIEYEWPADDDKKHKDKKHKTMQVSVGKNELAETSGDEWASFTLKYKRVDDFSPLLTKEDSQKGDTQDPVQKVATVQAGLTFKKHEASVESVAISPDGMVIASGGGDGVVLIWERATGKVKHKLDTLSRNEGVRGIAFSPDGSTVVCGSRLWNVETGEQRRGSFPGERAVISPDGKLLITATYDEVHAWDLVEDKKVFSKKTPGSISSIAISPDGKLVASSDYSNYVKVWDATTGDQTFSHKDSRAQVYSVAFSPDSTILAVDSGRIYPTLFDLRTSEKVPFKGDLANARFSRPLPLPDGKHLACEMSRDDSIRLWSLSTGEERLILKGHTSPIKAISVSQDGKWLVSASQDHTVKVWDVSSVVEAPIKLARPQLDKDLFTKRDAIIQVSALQITGTCVSICTF